MNMKYIAGLILACLSFTACDNTTEDIGISITDKADNLLITTDTFTVTTRSILVDSVLSRTSTAYLGKVRDPETGASITGDCMIQFHTLENLGFPEKDSIASLENGIVIADSAEIRLYPTSYYGDSLTPMKMRVYEMDTPMKEGVNYYSNFDPYKEGLVRVNGYQVDKPYTIINMTESDSLRNTSGYYNNIRVMLNDPYTDKNGKTYKNYGTYVMHKFYEDKSYFKNSYNFIHNVVPGFFFKNTSGLGSMAYVTKSQLNIYFRYIYNDSIQNGVASFSGTEEVLQTTTFTNDENTLKRLAADNTCTYLKTPSGIFTEMTLPVDKILKDHEQSIITSARVTLTRLNNSIESPYALGTPQTLLMLPKAQMYEFFENGKIVDFKSSFLASYASTTNGYTFGNISGLINYMDQNRNKEDWDKVVIIPVNVSYLSSGSSYVSSISSVVHDMSMSSTRLVGGSQNPNGPIKLSVIYSKFK